MSAYIDACGRKHNRLSVDDIILFGDSKYFNNDVFADYSYVCKYMEYRGLSAKLAKQGLSKSEAMKSAKEAFDKNACFSDGSKPFILVANLRGDLKWCVLSGDTLDNAYAARNHCF